MLIIKILRKIYATRILLIIKCYNKVETYSSKFSARKHFVLELFSVIFVASFLWFFKIVNNWINFWYGNIKIFVENGNKFKREFFPAKGNWVTNQCSSSKIITKLFSRIWISTSSFTSSRNVAISNCLLAGCMSRLYYSTLVDKFDFAQKHKGLFHLTNRETAKVETMLPIYIVLAKK